ncbi:hypothetical protein [Paenibacillus agricola]|uniref:Uncharacterized protein n=1 Tax=Paenibacillus agricola TaxID=2716264 RepID=A0ABX0J233_9BACL|nr:hypothetical protein [Paenibacillus agricola]NHN30350.1 hypothetical protein [Paenibacillus agricola]
MNFDESTINIIKNISIFDKGAAVVGLPKGRMDTLGSFGEMDMPEYVSRLSQYYLSSGQKKENRQRGGGLRNLMSFNGLRSKEKLALCPCIIKV